MAANCKLRSVDLLVIFVICILAMTQMALGLHLGLPQFTVPSNALPGHKVTDVIRKGQVSEIISEPHLKDLFQLAEDGALKIRDSLEHLANTDIALKLRHTLGNHTWDDVLRVRVSGESDKLPHRSYWGNIIEGIENQIVEGLEGLALPSAEHISYQLAGEGSDSFRLKALPNGTVEIYCAVPLSVTATPQINLQVVASTPTAVVARANVTIAVVGRNSHAPAFVMDTFVSSTYTGAPSGTRVVTVYATDADEGESGRVSYSMEPSSDVFSLDENTGVVSVKSPVTTGDYSFTVHARDHGNPPLPSLPSKVTIIVRPLSAKFHPYGDDIMYAPNLGQVLNRVERDVLPEETHTISEAEDVGDVVYTIVTGGMDVRYSMGTPANAKFSIDPISGDVTLEQALDFETSSEEILNVVLTNASDPDMLDTLRVVFSIQDADEPPYWTMEVSPYIAVVPLDAPNQACIYTLTAADIDAGTEITYFLRAGGNGWFSVDETSGCINTEVTADTNYVANEEYILSVYARGTRADVFSDVTASVSVYGGSYPPQFREDPYEASVNEAQANQVVTQITAESFKRNVAVTYLIIGPANRPTHTINAQDGTITLTEQVLYEELPTYFLTVQAVEDTADDPLTSEVRVNVMVEDINNCEPTFSQDVLSFNDVPETAEPGDTIATVVATDCDTGVNAELTYSIVTTSTVFSINSTSGDISPTSVLDYEKGPRYYTFTVSAMDGGNQPLSSTATVVISLADAPEAPVFNPDDYFFRMDETANQNYEVGTVYVSDDDVGDTITLAIIGGDGTFAINQNTGVISTVRTQPFSYQSLYQFNISATDSTGLESMAMAEISVTDLNDNIPSFPDCGTYAPSISEDANNGDEVIQVTAVDVDQGSNAELSYSISSNDNTNIALYFRINDDGVITTTGNLNREVTPIFEVLVSAEDGGDPALTGFCTFSITLNDVNDNPPVFSQSQYRTSVRSDAAVGDVVLTVTADDLDEVGTLIYGVPDTIDFGIIPITGQIIVRRDLTTVTPDSFTVTVTDGESTSSSNVVIDVRDPADTVSQPTFENLPYQVIIPENFAFNEDILVISATDGDDQIGFNIIQGLRPETNSELTFTLDLVPLNNTAILTLQQSLDFETVSSYSLTINAQSTSPYSTDTIATVTIEDVNDEFPIFPASTFYANILENQNAGTPVIRIQATDRDASEVFRQITYSILTADTSFEIDPTTGAITSTETFDREALDSETLIITVQASDGLNIRTAQVFIEVVDENDNEPVFTGDFSYEVAEDTPFGSVIGTVTATDADISQNLEYFISSGNQGGAFAVRMSTGEIVVTGNLDFETQTQYTLGYSVNDGLNTATTTVVVNITNVNDIAPQFTENLYTATVVENTDDFTSVIVQVQATDGDAGSSDADIVFSLIGTGAGTIFVIDEQTGDIRVTQELDREEVAQYDLVAIATDENGNGLSSYVDVVVTVGDVNDNVPSFPNLEYVGSVEENRPMGTEVMVVAAVDLDTDPLVYSIIQDDANAFAIDPDSGLVTTTEVLDREVQSEYEITVQVSDGSSTAQTTATITVLDVDDNRPVFVGEPYPPTTISEDDSVGSTVTMVTAADDDVDFREEVTFEITSGNINDRFAIISDPATLTGVVVVNSPLDVDDSSEPGHVPDPTSFSLQITVTDSVNAANPATTDITINIVNANDEVPVFDPSTYSGQVSEDAQPDDPVMGTGPNEAQIILLTATDNDPGTTLTYVIDPTTDPNGQFDVAVDGALVVASALDRETTASYELKVWAVDNGTPPQTGTATVNINILDVNDTPPIFAEDYQPEVMENSETREVIVTVFATDIDDPPAGDSFTYNVQSGPWQTYFTVPDTLNVPTSNGIRVQTNGVPIDREEFPYFDMVFEMGETDTTELLTGTSTLTITILDVNDNPHEAYTKNVLVYNYEGQNPDVNIGEIPTTQVGQVEVVDPDILDDKTYTIPEDAPFPEQFELDEQSGQIIMKEGTPDGVYTLKVIVSDGGEFPDQTSTVVVTVKEIPREAVFSSGSIRLSGTTAEALITPNEEGVTPLDTLKGILVGATGARPENLDIFSVINVGPNLVDVRYAAHGSPYYPADQLDLAALGVLDEIESQLGVTVAQLPVDLCVVESVCESSCSNVLKVNNTPTVVDSGSASFVAVSSYVEAVCECASRTDQPGTCESSPCLNGGTCVDVYGGTYQCTCPYGYDGPNCQQTKRSFNDGYASFATLRQCEETSLSIEFITQVSSGTLLYNGPLGPLSGEETDPMDVILLELVDGRARLTINLGSIEGTTENLVLSVTGENTLELANGEWHRIDVYRNGQFVEMTVDRCENAVVTETSSSTSADYSVCRVSGQTPGPNKFLNVKTPLFLGGVDPAYNIPRVTPSSGFDGCIRNLKSDGFLYDLETPGVSSKTEAGCPRTDGQCLDDDGNPVCNNGVCEADLDSYVCICYPGYSGNDCLTELTPYDFGVDSYVNYRLLDATLYNDGRTSLYQIMVRTREPSGLIWSISNANTYEYIKMEVLNSNLKVDWHLGDAPVSVTLDGFIISNGAWHVVRFDRYDNHVTITIDGGGGAKETESRESTFSELSVDPETLVIGAVVDLAAVSDDYMGCMNDPRIDNRYLGFTGTNDYAEATPSAGVVEGCPSDVCESFPCTGDLECLDHWRLYECICPVGTEPSSGDTCTDIIECEPNPCQNGGTCNEYTPGFNCTCPFGYRGTLCQESYATQVSNLGFSPLGIGLLILCILLIILVLLFLIVYTQQKDRKSANIFAVDPEDDIRENFINYDEEGGGEEDNDAYDLNTLRKPVNEVERISTSSLEKKPIQPESEMPRFAAGRPLGDDPNVGDFINDRLKGADDDPNGPPYDEPHLYDYEGEGSTAGSLSSLNSSSTESEQNYDYLNDWGPQFRKLADMYGS
ncbi:neural-cadherin-like [Diadema setosum]|uniref:neural-cadherin-like n=1 Tax=Diadema setosum TaxID=31175 RepID=UPI003B3A0717